MTSREANKPRELSARCAMSLLAAVMMVLGGARAARAHVDPSTCNHPGVAIEFLTFRSDGVTPINPGQTVSPCETIVYQVKLTKQNDPTVCAFEGGRIFITTADGVQHDVTPTTGVPCVGGTTSPCDPAVTQVLSQKLSFTINQATGQVGGLIDCEAELLREDLRHGRVARRGGASHARDPRGRSNIVLNTVGRGNEDPAALEGADRRVVLLSELDLIDDRLTRAHRLAGVDRRHPVGAERKELDR